MIWLIEDWFWFKIMFKVGRRPCLDSGTQCAYKRYHLPGTWSVPRYLITSQVPEHHHSRCNGFRHGRHHQSHHHHRHHEGNLCHLFFREFYWWEAGILQAPQKWWNEYYSLNNDQSVFIIVMLFFNIGQEILITFDADHWMAIKVFCGWLSQKSRWPSLEA